MYNNKLDIIRKNWRKLLQYRFAAVICFLVASTVSLAEKNEYQAELNRLLVFVANKEPTLFGSNALCERDEDFWDTVKKSSLLAVLEQQEGFQEIPVGQNHTVWFVPISTCYSGNRAGFVMLVKLGDKFQSVETPITGSIENVRLEGDNIVFNVTSYAGLFEQYHYRYSYDGTQLTQVLLKRIQQ